MSGLKLAKGKTVTLKSQIYAPGTGKQEEPGMDRYIDRHMPFSHFAHCEY